MAANATAGANPEAVSDATPGVADWWSDAVTEGANGADVRDTTPGTATFVPRATAGRTCRNLVT